MVKKQESGVKVILVLVLIAMFSAVLLAYVNTVTRGPIAANKKAETKKAIGIVLNTLSDYKYEELPKEMEVESSPVRYFEAVGSSGKPAGYAFIVLGPNGFSSDLEMMVGLDSSGAIIDTYVLDHKETPGLGDAMTKEPFKKQFRTRNAKNTKWEVKKDGGDIDAITAATITSRAFTAGCKRALSAYEKITEGAN
jgi:electron transport complex protein RnfG